MQTIKRDIYLNRLIERKENGAIKVITGIRRCGKSYLLFNLYYDYLLSNGIGKDRIIKIALDDEDAENLTDAKTLSSFIKGQIKDENTYYVFLDEIQFVKDFERFEPSVQSGHLCHGKQFQIFIVRYSDRISRQRGRSPCSSALLCGICFRV